MRRRTLILATLGAVACVAAAQAADSGASAPWWQQALAWVLQRQATLHRELSATLASLGREASFATAWTLVVTSFVYGVLHAAGPGHGKVILTTYLVSHERRVGPAVLLSAVSSFVQAAVAIVLVLGLIWIAGLAGRQAQDAALWAERASYVLVGALGGWLLWRELRGGHDHGHAHAGHDGHEHHHHDSRDHGGEAAHAHVVSPEAAARVNDLRTGAAVVLSVGLRPCSGAVLVLAVASLLGLVWAGVLAVLAMAVGTAITVCLLALFAVVASDRAARLARLEGRRLALAGRVVAGLGGAVILAVGGLLLWGSFGVAHPLGLGTG